MSEMISKAVIGCAVRVSRELGHGFLERVYEAALAVELDHQGISYERQKSIAVFYREQPVGEYCCDFMVDGRLLLELKALAELNRHHEAQVMNYLKATGIAVGLLLNFGTPTLGIRRIVHQYDEDQKI